MATEADAPYKLIQRQPPFNVRPVEPGNEYVLVSCIKVIARRNSFGQFVGRQLRRTGERLEHKHPKVKGKAAVKRAKRLRQQRRAAA